MNRALLFSWPRMLERLSATDHVGRWANRARASFNQEEHMVRSWMAASACALALMVSMGSGVGGTRLEARALQQEVKAPLLNINTATAAEFEKLPGVGPAMALRIVEYRQKNGGFKKIEELMNVRGIGEASFLKLKPQIMVAPVRAAER